MIPMDFMTDKEVTVMPTTEQKPDSNQVVEVKLTELHPFKNHPFKVLDDDLMQQTIDSILQVGLLSPAVVRPIRTVMDMKSYRGIGGSMPVKQQDSIRCRSL